MRSSLPRPRLATAVLLVLLAACVPPAAVAVSVASPATTAIYRATSAAVHADWRWPADRVRIVARYDAPPHAFAARHRGIDLSAARGTPLRAPADGVVVFAGVVADREVLTIDHGDGHVSSLEPVAAAMPRGTHVRAGDVVARVGTGGHAPVGSVHLGVRRSGHYIDPLELLGQPPRAVLLPCC
jgi:murein DD-endopeptidase MepM/ murein hydrolase activator NlpD